eukprot:Skav227527  [mRNA]  locus=scaffold2269:202655:203435:- [translate_table: standard]
MFACGIRQGFHVPMKQRWARCLASRVDIAASETTRNLLSQIQGKSNDGVLQSCTGGLLRLSMQGPVFVGQGLHVGDAPAVVLRFDRTGVMAAALTGTAEAGASVSCLRLCAGRGRAPLKPAGSP